MLLIRFISTTPKLTNELAVGISVLVRASFDAAHTGISQVLGD